MEVNFSKIYGSYDYKKVERRSIPEKTAKTDGQTDKVAVSSQAKDFQSVLKALSGTPDVREELVSDIRSKINAGKYNVSARDIAAKMLSKAY